jgi:aspartate-semialdehyde dehydrogenase
LADNNRVALVGSDSLLGREIRDIASGWGSLDLRLLAAAETSEVTLASLGDEPAVVEGLNAASLTDVRAILLAGSADSSRKALEIAGNPPESVIVDCTYATEEWPDARLRAPAVEPEDSLETGAAAHVIAHPAAIALALFLRRLQAHEPIRSSIVHVFAPASEHGEAGVEELQQQTVSLLSFKTMPKALFDAQLAFSMLAQYGEEAPVALEEFETRLERHLASLLDFEGDGEGAPMPSLRLLQAPVFHGCSFSVWVEFENDPGPETLEGLLATAAIDVRSADSEPPNNVGQAGQGGISVGAISPDRNRSEAYWFWVVADNLRLQADNAMAVLRQLV